MKKNEARMGTRLLPQPPPLHWEAKHSAPSIQKLLRGPWLIVDNFFPENMIDEEAFMLLDEASLKEMVPAVGPRKKFMKKLEEEKVF